MTECRCGSSTSAFACCDPTLSPNPKGEHGGYQGAYWDGEDFLVQMHGPNKLGLKTSKGMDRYRFNGTGFVFIRTEKPLTYGTGQGVAVYGEYSPSERQTGQFDCRAQERVGVLAGRSAVGPRHGPDAQRGRRAIRP